MANQSSDFYNKEAEELLIGSLIQKPELYAKVQEIVSYGDFYDPACAILFEMITEFIQNDTPVNAANVRVYLADRKLKNVDVKYVAEILRKATSVGSAETYARKVREWSARRSLLETCRKAEILATQSNVDIMSTLRVVNSSIENQVADYKNIGHGRTGFMDWDSLLDVSKVLSPLNRLEILEARAKNLTNPKPPLCFGFNGMDNPHDEENIVLLPRRRLCTVVASSSVGKTSFALHMACANARMGSHVLYLFNELDEDELRRRIECGRSNVSYNRLYRHFNATLDLTTEEEARVTKAAQDWAKWPGSITFQSISEKSVYDVRRIVLEMSQARKEAHALELRKAGLDPEMARGYDLVIVDYLTLLAQPRNQPDDYNKNDIIELGNLSVDPDLDLSVVAVVQLKKMGGSEKDEAGNEEYPRPDGGNFSGSQFIKNRSNIMIGLTRHVKDGGGNKIHKGTIIVIKNGSGPANFDVPVEYISNRFRWRDDSSFTRFGPEPLPDSNYQPVIGAEY